MYGFPLAFLFAFGKTKEAKIIEGNKIRVAMRNYYWFTIVEIFFFDFALFTVRLLTLALRCFNVLQ